MRLDIYNYRLLVWHKKSKFTSPVLNVSRQLGVMMLTTKSLHDFLLIPGQTPVSSQFLCWNSE